MQLYLIIGLKRCSFQKSHREELNTIMKATFFYCLMDVHHTSRTFSWMNVHISIFIHDRILQYLDQKRPSKEALTLLLYYEQQKKKLLPLLIHGREQQPQEMLHQHLDKLGSIKKEQMMEELSCMLIFSMREMFVE